jgi:hypothetical protein
MSSFIDQTINQRGQDYFKAGYFLVGNSNLANYQTDGTDDQVQLQDAIDDALANISENPSSTSEVVIISNLNVNANSSYTEVISGISRRLAVKLRDNVTIKILSGCTISFGSGGNSGFNGGTVFTSVFGNFGDLTGARVICEGLNAFDGLSSTAGSSTDKQSAIWLDARSNSCTTLKDCSFEISGKRTAGPLVYTYNSNVAGTEVAKSINTKILKASSCLTAFKAERNGQGINLDLVNATDSISDTVVYSQGVTNSTINIGLIQGSLGYGLNCSIDDSINTKFNSLNISGNITGSALSNAYLVGTNGSINLNSNLAQRAGLQLAKTTTSSLSPNKLEVKGQYFNNNQSSSGYSGVQGIVKNVTLIGVEATDTQGSPTQKYGLDFSNTGCDYIDVVSCKAENNTQTGTVGSKDDSQIVVYGVNSRVSSDTVGFTRTVTVADSATYAITSPHDIYSLGSASILTLPTFGNLSTKLQPKYQVLCTSGTSTIKTAQEVDTTYKAIDSVAGDTGVSLGSGYQRTITKFSTKWNSFESSSSSLLTAVGGTAQNITATGATISTSGYKAFDTTSGNQSHTLGSASAILGQTIILKKTSKDFNSATFTTSGTDTIEQYTAPLLTPTGTTATLILPDEIVELKAVVSPADSSKYHYRVVSRSRSFKDLRSSAFINTTSQNIANSVSAYINFDVITYDKIKDVDSTFGFGNATNAWKAPVDGEIEIDLRLSPDNGTAAQIYNIEIQKNGSVVGGAKYFFEERAWTGYNTFRTRLIHEKITVAKNDVIKIEVGNNSGTALDFYTRTVGTYSFLNELKIKYVEINYA